MAATSSDFGPVSLPPNVGYLNAVSCVRQGDCFVAGQTAGTNQRGLILHVVGGVWHSTVISAAAYLNGISCVDATHCAAVGVSSDAGRAGAGVVVTTTDGSTWQLPPQPSPAITSSTPAIELDWVSCVGTFCMADGTRVPNGGGATTSQVWVTSGAGWTAAAAPIEPGGSYLGGLDCTRPGDCWMVGGGAWHTSNGGSTWTIHDPPQGSGIGLGSGFGISYSELNTAQFTDPMHGIIAGGDQCGGDTDHCGGVIFRTGDGGASWTRTSNAATPLIEAMSCHAPGRVRCVATSATFTPIRPGGATANVVDGSVVLTSSTGSSWQTTQRIKFDHLDAVACPTASECVAVGGDQARNVGVVFTNHPLPVPPATLSTVATAISPPTQAFRGVGRTVVNASITLAAMLALTFPSQLFNRTFEENYDEIVAIAGRRFGWLTRARARTAANPSHRRDLMVFLAVVAVGSVIGSLRDPQFGPNTRSALLFLATALAVLLTTATAYAVTRGYRARAGASVDAHLHALPAGLAIAALCVAVSRVAKFEPGYLYGVICGTAFAGTLKRRQNGQLTSLTSLAALTVAVGAWFAWIPINHDATQHGAFFGLVLLDDLLGSLFVGGITGTVIVLLPLRFMPGEALFSWHRGMWAATFGVATFGLVEILLRPASGTTSAGSVAWVTAAVLFVIFGVGSLAFREYFARHLPADQQRAALAAKIITHLRDDDGRSETDLAMLINVEPRHVHATIDRLERANWIRREKTFQVTEAEVPLHLSTPARTLHESRRVGWFTRRRLVLALTRADRNALAHLFRPHVKPARQTTRTPARPE
ncbi:MAG TPA: FGLLP motif-containing membrane protein [Acidothermaceae bacterium]|nr:FGLLP motif-containing membrane protein [Acidothermaceae bacterium]